MDLAVRFYWGCQAVSAQDQVEEIADKPVDLHTSGEIPENKDQHSTV